MNQNFNNNIKIISDKLGVKIHPQMKIEQD